MILFQKNKISSYWKPKFLWLPLYSEQINGYVWLETIYYRTDMHGVKHYHYRKR